MKYAVIDLSSTGVSVVVADGDGKGSFTTVYKERANIAVTDYFDGKSISKRGIEKLIDALVSAKNTCKAMSVDECYCISTAALRNIDNIKEVAEKIRIRTGIVINYLDGKTEAYCDLVANAKYSECNKPVLIDIGGGSVELCDYAKTEREDTVCLNFGPIKLRGKYVTDVYPTDAQADKIKKFLRKKFDENELPDKDSFKTAVLVGSINEAVYAAFKEFCEMQKLSSEYDYDNYKSFCKWLLTSSDRTRLLMKVAPEKIHLLPVAALILKELLKRFKPKRVVISDAGVKEGYMALIVSGRESGIAVNLNAPAPAFEEVPRKSKKKNKV